MATLQPNSDAEVSIKEQGTLKIYVDILAITATGTASHNLRVPTGKKWNVKQILSEKQSGTFTISSLGTYFVDEADQNILLDSDTTNPNNVELQVNNGTTLPQMWSIQQNIGVTAFTTTGNVKMAILVMESDV